MKIDKEEQTAGFRDALYDAKCGECESGLDWEAQFDADGTNYYAHCCGFRYAMRPQTVSVTRERDSQD